MVPLRGKIVFLLVLSPQGLNFGQNLTFDFDLKLATHVAQGLTNTMAKSQLKQNFLPWDINYSNFSPKYKKSSCFEKLISQGRKFCLSWDFVIVLVRPWATCVASFRSKFESQILLEIESLWEKKLVKTQFLHEEAPWGRRIRWIIPNFWRAISWV